MANTFTNNNNDSKGTILLKTKRLCLIAASPEHADFISSLYNHEEVKPWLLDYGLDTPEDAITKYIPLGESYYKENGFCMCVIQEISSGELIGIGGMLKRPFLDAPNIGYALKSTARGQGFMTESCKGLAQLCRDKGFKKMYAGNVDSTNDKSIGVLTRLGMRLADSQFEWGPGGTVGHLYCMSL